MSIHLAEDTQVAALWFADGKTMNFMAAITRQPGEPLWRMQCRFRHYRDSRAFNSNDERTWYEGEVKPDMPVEVAVRNFDTIVQLLCTAAGLSCEHFAIYGTGLDAIARIKDRPWFQMRKAD